MIEVEHLSERCWASRAADLTVSSLRHAIRERGLATLAVSGGSTPAPYFQELSQRELSWGQVTIVQVDERVVPMESTDRNLVQQRAALGRLPVSWLPLPVEHSEDPVHLKAFVVALRDLAGVPPVLDVVHLGLGSDGHTASLVPNDPVLEEGHHVIARTNLYQGTHRLTITAPTLSRARLVLWLVKGQDKADPLKYLLRGDPAIPASLVRADRSVVVATGINP